MGKASKRARKVALSQSLRAKQNAQGFVQGLDLLDRREGDEEEERRATELLAAHAAAQAAPPPASSDDDADADGDGAAAAAAALALDPSATDGANALILPSKAQQKAAKQQRQQKKARQLASQGPQLSKAELRRLKQVAQRKARRDELAASFGALAASSLGAEQLALLRPVHQRGARETKKQRLRRALKLMRAGATEAELAAQGLLVEGELLRRQRERPAPGEEESSESESESEEEEDQRRPGVAGAAAAARDDDGSDEDDDSKQQQQQTAFGAASAARRAAAGVAVGGGSRAAAAARAGAAADRPAPETLAGGLDAVARPGEQQQGQQQNQQPPPPPPTDPREAARALREAVAKARAELGLPPLGARGGGGRAGPEDDDDDPEEAALRRLALETTRAAARNLASEAAAAASLADTAGGAAADAAATTTTTQTPTPARPRVVAVHRPPEIDAARRELPVVGMEAEILEAVAASDVVVLCGETGSGKTTQVPQFLLEAGYGCPLFPERSGVVAVTQPRRVAAIATAERVAAELGRPLDGGDGGGGKGGGGKGGKGGGKAAPSAASDPTSPPPVGYQVRHDRRLSSKTPLQFVTDGVLLRHLQSDLMLKQFSAVVVDEAHERSLNTDLLLGLLSRVVPLRRRRHEAWASERRSLLEKAREAETKAVEEANAANGGGDEDRARGLLAEAARLRAQAASLEPVWPLKLLVMSATLRTADFVDNRRLFPVKPPLITVPARQFPVTVHFARRTPTGEGEYAEAAFRKVARIHSELPAGGILVFLTGQREVESLCRRLRRKFPAAVGAAEGGDKKEEEEPKEDEEEEGEAAAGADAAEIGGERADAAAGVGLASESEDDDDEDKDDFALMELDEEEEETVLLGTVLDGGVGGGGGGGASGGALAAGSSFTPEQLAAAEAAFEARYGLSLSGGGTQKQQQDGAVGAGGEGAAAGATATAATAPATATTTPPSSGPPPMHVLPLYAMLPQRLQARVFEPPPPGHRLVVVATNVAETSLTIPGVRYVVDAGRAKERVLLDSAGGGDGSGGGGGENGNGGANDAGWDPDAAARLAASGEGGAAGDNDGSADAGGDGGVVRYEVRWVSKASAAQRAGRAGRTGPGHCYRLYSSAHYGDAMRDHSAPEISSTPLEGVALTLRAMGVDRVARFPFPSPPPERALRRAQRRLEAIGALERRPLSAAKQKDNKGGAAASIAEDEEDQLRLTDVGRVMALLPVGPRQARAIVQALQWAALRLSSLSSLPALSPSSPSQSSSSELALLRDDAPRCAPAALPYVVAMAAALSIESPFIFVDGSAAAAESGGGQDGGGEDGKDGEDDEDDDDPAARQRRSQSAAAAHAPFRGDGQGDAVAAVRALCAYEAELARALERGRKSNNKGTSPPSSRAALIAAAASAEAWCRRAFLLSRNLREMSELRRQLVRTLLRVAGSGGFGGGGRGRDGAHPAMLRLLGPALCGAVAASSSSAAAASSPPPPSQQPLLLLPPPDKPLPSFPPQPVCDALRRAQLAGWPDQVARRVRSAEHAARTAAGGAGAASSAGRAVRYAPCSLADDVFLHPRSALRAAAPEFVVYSGLVRTAKRCYMGGVAGVEAAWLASVGPPVCVVAPAAAAAVATGAGSAAPRYSQRLDAVVEAREATYGPRGWLLPRVARVPAAAEDRAAAFAAALLAGQVFEDGRGGDGASSYSSSLSFAALLRPELLVAPPQTAAKPELRGLQRVGELVGALARRGVDSRSALLAVWRREAGFLRRELRAWVRPGPAAAALDKAWPEVVRRALVAAAASVGGKEEKKQSGGKRAAGGGGGAEDRTTQKKKKKNKHAA